MSFEFLIEMGWKSALVAGAALFAGLLLKSRSAQDKAAMLRLAVGLVLLLPLISLLGPALQLENPLAREAASAAPDLAALAALDAASAVQAAADAPAAAPSILDRPGLLVGLAYLAGLLLLILRLAGGYMTLQRWTWAAQEVESPVWRRALESARIVAGDKRGTRLLLSESVPAPLSWGWSQPVILIDQETFDRPEDADAVLAHEMAHVVRADWVALMLSRLAVAFFWFNPLIWWLDREMIQQSEEAADAKAVADVEPAHYAQTLMSCIMHSRGGMVPANSIRPSRNGLSRRIYAVLDGRARAIRSGSKWTLAAMAGCVAFAAPLAALEWTAPQPPETPAAPEAPKAPMPPEDGGSYRFDGTVPPAPPAPPSPPGDVHEAAARLHETARRAQEEAFVSAEEARKLKMDLNIDMSELNAQLSGLEGQIASATAIAIAEAGNARAVARQAHAEARRGLAMGADDMDDAARDMEEGAKDLVKEAARLESHSYREKQIAKAVARGETVTHEDLLNAIPKMRDGAKGMRKGAQDMRKNAARMRRGD